MVKRIHIWLVLFSLMPLLSLATHIVGGSLTYVYNGGSNYTITLKLYKDCGPGTAGFPANVTISVLGNNGQPFTPSKDITINLGTVTNIPSNLNPCAVPPNPMPCVQEGIYSITVNNLPPNAGGYHLYYQIVARNLSLTNVNGACNCIGESFYANIPGMTVNTIWNEDFTLPNNTTVDNGVTSWSLTAGVTSTVPATASVNGNLFEMTGANSASKTWTSQVVNIAACTNANLSVDLSENGNLDTNDSIRVYYRLNGGALIPFPTNGSLANDFNTAVATANGLVGTTIQIVIRVHYDNNSPTSEIYRFDNITIGCTANDFKPNSNAVFNLFPPLFICVNQPFSFNHAATDANGDSLVYSLYRPYDGDAGAGALDPTFPGNVATFTPVTYLGGYTFTNPLGAGPFNLNPTTGLLTGTPGTLGQFVVGVMVKEYRNGVYLSQTLRDFQFNVLNCPQPPPTLSVPNATVNNGCSASLTATGVSSTSVTWNSIFPGAPGAYNSYLACTSGCLNNTVTSAPTGTPPAYVDFVVCGTSTSCSGAFVCDTFRVKFNPTLAVNILPSNPTLCFGQTSTTITAVGSGGTPPYTYLWNNVNPSQTINVGVGTYNVQLNDATNCPPVFNSVTVTAFTVAVTANAGPNQTKCAQSPIATLSGSVTGSTGGIWSGGLGSYTPGNTTLANMSYSPSPAELAAGSATLFLTTTGNGSCPSKKDTVVINYSNFAGVATPTVTNVSCFGGTNGSATISMTGGFAPYTYLWNTSPTQTTATANNLPIGTYSVTIQDGIGCTHQTTVNITQPVALSINANVTNVSCFGTNTGSIAATPAGGTSPYTYSWTPGGQTTSSVTSLAAGNYSVTVTDNKGCQRTAAYAITQPTLIAVTFTQTNVSCFGGNNASVNTTVSGGTAPYTYSWGPGGSTSPNPSGLTGGNYTLTITDNLGCIATRTMAITQPTVLAAVTSVTNESCNYLNNGSASVTASGGTTPYTYLWQPGGQITTSITNQSSGSYTVTVTDNNGCTATSVATITEPVPLTVGFINQIDVSCFGGSDGSIGANPSGGTPNYTYSWSPGGSTNSTLSNIPIGTYTVLVTDSRSCTATNTIIIIQPTDLIINNVNTNVSCNGGNNGSIALTPSGATPPYTYFWSAGGQTTSSVTGLAAGNYSATVTDNNGCQKTAVYTITQPTPIAITFTQTNVSCFNGSNGAVNTGVTGGTSPYTYSWSPGGSNSPNPSGLQAGTYTLMVTDNFSCTATSTIAITQPTVLTAATSVTNESCNYLNNGSATVTAFDGTGPYTYLWQPGAQTTTVINNQSSGTYTVTVTDNNGCTATSIATITEPVPLTVGFINQIDVSCFGGSDGSIGANPSGGTPNYTYSWSPGGSTNSTLSNIPIGTYTVLVTDSKSCTATNTVIIIQPTDLVINNITTNVSCNGGSDGSIALTPSGATPPYTYFWSAGGQTTSSVTGLAAGNYSVTVTDNNSCQKTAVYTITQPTPIAITFTQTNVSCFNGSNGTVNTGVTGGTSPYTYSWNPGGSTSPNPSGLQAGTYTLTVTDNFSCTATSTVAITQPTVLTAATSVTNESCHYLNNGSATVTAFDGTAPYTYLWQPGAQTTTVITNQSSGSYTVTITDNNGCIATEVATITEPVPLTVGFVDQVNVNCFGGNNASIGANPAGGTPNYTYSWSPGGATTNALFNITAGIYTVTITDNNNCTITNTISITQPTTAVSVVLSSTPTACNGSSDGSSSATASGGTPTYTYSWMPGSLTGQTISAINSNTYTVTATDLNGCTITNTVFVNEPTPILPVTTTTNSTCGNANGTASVSVTGGIGPYTYSWTPTGGTGTLATGLLAGAYNIIVTDNNGCTAIEFTGISDTGGPIASILSTTNAACFGGASGAVTASVTGGAGPLTYSWSPTGGTGLTATGLTAGSYYITITDVNGCISLATTNPDITEPTDIILNIVTSNVNCFAGANGSATVTASGGTPAYTYTWLPGATTGSVVTGLSANIYTVQASDANGCIKTATYSISQPTAALSIAVSSSSVSCFGATNGSASSTASGGTSPYNYNWMPGNISGQNISNLPQGTYTITVTDIKGCVTNNTVSVIQATPIVLTAGHINANCGLANGQASVSASGGQGTYSYSWTPTGGTGTTATGLIAGTYTVKVTDGNSCRTSTTQIIVNNPGPVLSVSSSTNVSCFGGNNGSAFASVVGGTGPFTYTWTPFGGNTATATGLTAGSYTVNITSGNGCNASAATSPNITQPTLLFANITTSNVSCFAGANGSATITAGGGTPAYTYTWLPGGTNGPTVSGLTATSYSVVVADANNCTRTFTYAITQPTAALSIAVSSTSISCFGGSNGTASSTASGGTVPYNYNWMPGNISGQNISNLSNGTYTITTTDIKGCVTTSTINVVQPTPIALITGGTNSDCGFANGQTSVSASGGQGTYTYTWMPGAIAGTTATALLAGTYTVNVTDGNSCATSTTQTIGDNPGPIVSVSSTTNVSCFGGNNGSAFVSVIGGTGPFTYTWTPLGGNAQTATGLTAGNYTVNITSGNGCPASAATSPNITEPPLIFANITTANASCFSGANGSATITAGGGTPGYTYTWMPGATTGSVVTGLTANTYSVNVTDANNCLQTFTYAITQPTAAVSASATSSAVSCFGGNNGTATVSVTGGTSPYNYNWLPMNVNSTTVSGLTTGIYSVDVTDIKNCTTSTTVMVTQPTQSLSTIANSVPTSCSGGSDGTATVTPVGGTAGYTYLWSPTGGTAQTASGLLPGNYIVTVNDANSCQTNVSVIVSAPTALAGSLTPIDAACGLANGSVTSQVSGGFGPYTYSWTPGSITTSTIGGILPGTYTLQVTDFFGCIHTLTTSLTNIPGPSVTLTSTVNTSCFGSNDGAATITITQGTPSYTINWQPYGGNATTASSLTAGTYTANVTDTRGCLNSITALISEPTPLAITINSITNVSCFNGSDGSLTVTASGGTPSYSYTWSNSATGQTTNSLTAGSYTVNVTDSHNCPTSISMSVSEPAVVLTSTITSALNPACFNSTGSSSVAVTGGTAPYTYTWTTSPVQNGSTATNLVGGTYTVDISDANGCTSSNTVTLVQPTQIISNGGINDTMCLGQTGVVIASASGGVGNYYYTWQPANVTNSGTLSVAPPANTNYTVVAFDQNGCAGIPDTVKAIVYTLTASNLQTFGLSPICPGQSSMISALASGNTGPITYSWTNGVGSGPGPFLVSPTVPTDYIVTVSNSCGASVSETVSIAINSPPTVIAAPSGTLSCIPSSSYFFDNSTTGNPNDPIVTWLWNFGDGTTSNLQNPDHVYLSSGQYSVTVTVTTDGGCTNSNNTSPIVVNAFPNPDAAFSVNTNVLNIPYDVLNVTNQSVGAINYNWSFGDGATSTATNPSHLYTSIGNYQIQLIATSAYGCTDTAYADVITDAEIVFPNAFTPNPNGGSGGYYNPGATDNDIFYPYNSGVVDYKLQIFNRWGELIFETFDIKQGWDGYYRGKLSPIGVYIWKAYAKLNNDKVFNKTGDVTLLR